VPLRRNAKRAAALALISLGLAACHDTTGPDTQVSVVAAAVPSAVIGTTPEGYPSISCSVDLRASAGGGGRARWLDATFYYYVGRDRTTPIDSELVLADAIRQSWGEESIGSGETLTSGWDFSASVPFAVEIAYRYEPESGRHYKTARVSFSCGPTATPTTQPPALSAITLSPLTNVQAGDTLTVSYTATSALGLWETAVVLWGSCRVERTFGEALASSATRTVRVVVPSGCTLGQKVIVTVHAVDAALQEGLQAVEGPGVFVDTRPPRLTAWYFPPSGGSLTPAPITGDYFGGDAIRLLLEASDNNALRTIVWEILPTGLKDSVAVSGQYAAPWVNVPLPSNLSGPIQLRIVARDESAGTSDVVESPVNGIRVYPTLQRPVKSLTVDGEIRDFVLDEKRGVAYLLQSNQRRVAVLSLATMTIVSTLQSSFVLTDVDLSASGDSLVMTTPLEPALVVVDLNRSPLQAELFSLRSLSPALEQPATHVRVASNGHAFLSLGAGTSASYGLAEVDFGARTQRIRTDAGNGGAIGEYVERSHDGSTLVLNTDARCFQRFDVSTDRFGPCQQSPVGNLLPNVDGGGQHVAFGLDVYDATLKYLRRVSSPITGGIPYSALSADGEYLYQALGSFGLVRSRVSDGAMVDRSPNPIVPNRVRTSADGTMVVTVDSYNGSTSRISVIDMR